MSSQAAYPSLPAEAGSSVIPLLLLSHEVHSALRGFPAAYGDRRCASSLHAAYPSLPAEAESSVISLLLLSHEVHSALRGIHKRPMGTGAALRASVVRQRRTIRHCAPRNVFSATYTPPPKMIAVPFAPIGRETLRGFFDKLKLPSRGAFLFTLRSANSGHCMGAARCRRRSRESRRSANPRHGRSRRRSGRCTARRRR